MDLREAEWRRAMLAERKGDAPAYRAFLVEFARCARGAVAANLRRLGQGALDVEDIVQEALVAVHIHRRQWDPSRPITPWLAAIVRYKTIDAVRRSGRARLGRVDLSEMDWLALPAADAPDPERPLADVRQRLMVLPPAQQTAVRLIALEGASYRQAADRLQTTEGAIRVSFHRALRTLANLIHRETRP
jgi:RNA polymerase sigma factor (sigma-70 family)